MKDQSESHDTPTSATRRTRRHEYDPQCRPDSHRVKPCLLTERALRGARRRYVNTTWQPRRRRRLSLRIPLRLCSARARWARFARHMLHTRGRSKIVDDQVRQIMLEKIDVIYSDIKLELRAILSRTVWRLF